MVEKDQDVARGAQLQRSQGCCSQNFKFGATFGCILSPLSPCSPSCACTQPYDIGQSPQTAETAARQHTFLPAEPSHRSLVHSSSTSLHCVTLKAFLASVIRVIIAAALLSPFPAPRSPCDATPVQLTSNVSNGKSPIRTHDAILTAGRHTKRRTQRLLHSEPVPSLSGEKPLARSQRHIACSKGSGLRCECRHCIRLGRSMCASTNKPGQNSIFSVRPRH